MKMNKEKDTVYYAGIDKKLYDQSNIDELKEYDVEFWIWQFMRRSSRYKKAYDKCMKELHTMLAPKLTPRDKKMIKNYLYEFNVIEYMLGKKSIPRQEQFCYKWYKHFKKYYGLEMPCNYNSNTLYKFNFYPAIKVLPQKTNKNLYNVITTKGKNGKLVRVATHVSFMADLRYSDKTLNRQFNRTIVALKNANYSEYKGSRQEPKMTFPQTKRGSKQVVKMMLPKINLKQIISKVTDYGRRVYGLPEYVTMFIPYSNKELECDITKYYDDGNSLDVEKLKDGKIKTFEQDLYLWDIREQLLEEIIKKLSSELSCNEKRKRALHIIKFAEVYAIVRQNKNKYKSIYVKDIIKRKLFEPRGLTDKSSRLSLKRAKEMIEDEGYRKLYKITL